MDVSVLETKTIRRNYMTPLPHIGRPSKTGLSVKELGYTEYRRRVRAATRQPSGRYWTGLSDKQLGHAKYLRLYRELRRALNASKVED